MEIELLQGWLPIGISLVSLGMAGVALGWNIYRDVVLKARVAVSFAVVEIVTPRDPSAPRSSFLRIRATNHGPGPVQITSIGGRIAPLWRRLLRRSRYFMILNDTSNRLNPALPNRLELGEEVTLYLPHDEHSFLGTDATHIGVTDSFGREHFAPARDVREGRKTFANDFLQKKIGS
jgi:hypothetical protein